MVLLLLLIFAICLAVLCLFIIILWKYRSIKNEDGGLPDPKDRDNQENYFDSSKE